MSTTRRCPRCRGTGNIKKHTPVIINQPIARIDFGLFTSTITRRNLGKVVSPTICTRCKGKGRIDT